MNMFTTAEYSQKCGDFISRALHELKTAGVDYTLVDRNESEIILAFAGQYSAGKSSIIKMLTGNDNIEIGPGITTQRIHVYDWNELKIVDTPGINTELRPDHDEISYAAIAEADMLVFVVTSHLFDSHIADHFRKLAIDKDKGNEMILVVNKMEETGEGNTEWQQGILREDLCKVITPYTPEELHLCFLDAKSYLDSVNEKDPETKADLIERSGYSDFVESLNSFAKQNKFPLKLTTSLYKVGELIQNGIQTLEPKSNDEDVDSLMEFYLQQRHTLVDGKIRLMQEMRSIFSNASMEIRNIGLEAADLIEEGCTQEEVEEQLERKINEAETKIDDCQTEAIKILDTRLNELDQAQESIAQTEFAKELEMRLSYKMDTLPDGIRHLLDHAGDGMKDAGGFLAAKAYRPGVKGGLRLGDFSGGAAHEIVLKAGHAIGFKFKPWQAVKIAKAVGIAGKALSVLGVGLNVFMQIKSDKDEENVRIEMKKNRQNIRSQFNSAAFELEDFGKQFVDKYVVAALDEPIHSLDTCIQSIRAEKKNKTAACRTLETLQNECYSLIQEIHSMGSMLEDKPI